MTRPCKYWVSINNNIKSELRILYVLHHQSSRTYLNTHVIHHQSSRTYLLFNFIINIYRTKLQINMKNGHHGWKNQKRIRRSNSFWSLNRDMSIKQQNASQKKSLPFSSLAFTQINDIISSHLRYNILSLQTNKFEASVSKFKLVAFH